jgi:hypothetical protein
MFTVYALIYERICNWATTAYLLFITTWQGNCIPYRNSKWQELKGTFILNMRLPFHCQHVFQVEARLDTIKLYWCQAVSFSDLVTIFYGLGLLAPRPNSQHGGPDLCIYVPQTQDGPAIPPRHQVSLLVASYDMQGYGGVIVLCSHMQHV